MSVDLLISCQGGLGNGIYSKYKCFYYCYYYYYYYYYYYCYYCYYYYYYSLLNTPNWSRSKRENK